MSESLPFLSIKMDYFIISLSSLLALKKNGFKVCLNFGETLESKTELRIGRREAETICVISGCSGGRSFVIWNLKH